MMHIKNKTASVIIQAAIWVLTLVSTVLLFKKTAVSAVLPMTETLFMYIEILVVALWFFAALYFIDSLWISWTTIAIVAYIFLWMHRIALPVLISGMYVFYLMTSGEALLNIIAGGRKEDRIRRALYDFITGAAIQLTVTGILNAFGIGGIPCSRIIAIVIFAVSAIYIGVIRFSKQRVTIPCAEIPSDKELKQEEKKRIWICMALAILGAMMLLQAGRINITLDYDSLHYGLRSKYILDNGRGIFENLGSINDVYVYPKGLETLVLPLVTDVTYGFVLSFSWWMCGGILLCIYCIVKKFNCRRAGVYAAMFAAAVPGIMNMGISAKTDAITVFIQLIAITEILNEDYVRAGSALLFSLAFKPTSILFSGLIFVTTLIYLLVIKKKIDLKRWYISVPVILAVGFITARTVILTGSFLHFDPDDYNCIIVLLYAMAVILFFIAGENIYHWMLPVVLMNMILCGTTNWSGSVGLTPAKFQHFGFYDHESDTYDRMIAEGNKEIYEFLARDKTQRVVAFAEQPGCLGFRCNVQSYTDIEGSGGNVYLVKTLDLFREFLDYAKTDYIYVNNGFLETHERAADIVRYMTEEGSLTIIIDEGNNRLYEYLQK